MSDELSVALFNDTSNDGHFGCDLVMGVIEKHLASRSMKVCFRHPVEDDWRSCDAIKSGSVKPDIVIVNGEGTIHHPATWERGAILAEVGPYAKNVLKVPSFLINATVHDLNQKTADNLRCFDKIFVRDTYSRRHLQSFDVLSSVVPDLSLGADFKRTTADNLRAGICGTDSVFLDVAAELRELSRKNKWVHAPISRHWNPEMYMLTSPQQYLDVLMAKELVITGRYHVATICLLTATPFVAIESNTPKISSLVQDVLGSNFRMIKKEQISTLDPMKYAGWSDEEAPRVSAFQEKARQSIPLMFSEIKDYASQLRSVLQAKA